MDIGGSRPAKGFPAWLPNEETCSGNLSAAPVRGYFTGSHVQI